jgi:hypothetical protein
VLKESFEEYDVTAKTSSFLKDVFPEAHNYKESVGVMFDLGLNIVSDEEDCFVDFTGPETKHHLEHFLNNCNQDSENIVDQIPAELLNPTNLNGSQATTQAPDGELTLDLDISVSSQSITSQDPLDEHSFARVSRNELSELQANAAAFIGMPSQAGDHGAHNDYGLHRKKLYAAQRNFCTERPNFYTGGMAMSWNTDANTEETFLRFPKPGVGGVQGYRSGQQKVNASNSGVSPDVFHHFASNVRNYLTMTAQTKHELLQGKKKLLQQLSAVELISDNFTTIVHQPFTTRFEFYCIADGNNFDAGAINDIDFFSFLVTQPWSEYCQHSISDLKAISTPLKRLAKYMRGIETLEPQRIGVVATIVYLAHIFAKEFGSIGCNTGVKMCTALNKATHRIQSVPRVMIEDGADGVGIPFIFLENFAEEICFFPTYSQRSSQSVADVLRSAYQLRSVEATLMWRNANIIPLIDRLNRQDVTLTSNETAGRSDMIEWFGGIKSGPRNHRNMQRHKTGLTMLMHHFGAEVLVGRSNHKTLAYCMMSPRQHKQILKFAVDVIINAYYHDLQASISAAHSKHGRKYPGFLDCFGESEGDLFPQNELFHDFATVRDLVQEYLGRRDVNEKTKIGFMGYADSPKTKFGTLKKFRKELFRKPGNLQDVFCVQQYQLQKSNVSTH